MIRDKGLTAAVAIVVMGVMLSAVRAEITILRDGAKLKRIELRTGKGKSGIVILPKLWSNTTSVTESGKEFALIDPFFYSVSVKIDGKNAGGYLNKPEIFAGWEAKEIKDEARPDASILYIAAAPEEYGVKKEVTVVVEKGRNVAYVWNRLTVMRDLRLNGDRQYYFFGNPEPFTVTVDGREIDVPTQKSWFVNRYACFYDTRKNVTYAVVFMDRKTQDFPGADKAPLGYVLYYEDKKYADMYWRKGGGKMAKGQSRTQRYILVWGDGDLKDQVEELSRKAMAGEVNDKVHVPSDK